MTRTKLVSAVAAVAASVAIAVVVLPVPDHEPASSPTRAGPPSARAAVQAATRFLVGMDASTLLDGEARREFVARWASRPAEPRLQRLYRAEAERLALFDRGYSRAALLGHRMDRIRASSAEVTIWAVSLASVGDMPPAVGWRTFTVGLVNENGHWRIARVGEVPGPSLDSRPVARPRASLGDHGPRDPQSSARR